MHIPIPTERNGQDAHRRGPRFLTRERWQIHGATATTDERPAGRQCGTCSMSDVAQPIIFELLVWSIIAATTEGLCAERPSAFRETPRGLTANAAPFDLAKEEHGIMMAWAAADRSESTEPAPSAESRDPSRTRWCNVSYDTTIQHIGERRWVEIDNTTGNAKWSMEEKSRDDDCIVLFNPTRSQLVRVTAKTMELQKDGKWEWLSNGHWDPGLVNLGRVNPESEQQQARAQTERTGPTDEQIREYVTMSFASRDKQIAFLQSKLRESETSPLPEATIDGYRVFLDEILNYSFARLANQPIGQLQVGSIGKLDDRKGLVLQVINESEMLCRVGVLEETLHQKPGSLVQMRVNQAFPTAVWIRGVSTVGLADDQSVDLPQVFVVAGTKTYITGDGTTATVMVLEAIERERIEKCLIEFRRASEEKKADEARDEAERKEAARWRNWTDKSGRFTVVAEFLKFELGKVHLRRKDNGAILSISPSLLDAKDQQWIRENLMLKKGDTKQ